MTGVGFFEILLIAVVGLLILGPDKLPGALRTMALWMGRFRRSFDDIKRDIEKEIGADDIRRQLRNEAIMDKFQEGKKQITDTVDKAKKQTDSIKSNLDLKQQILDSGKSKADSPTDNSKPADPVVSPSSPESLAPQTKASKEPKEPNS
ncbi:MAG: Sec-independent protein translocase protein TatB [Gammaproteobacteria bacterium]|jgi:sec-independent protein translocase protein TatB|nr:Sec-independent protein translocase protein TatB [Gammaproteobacteria bacterium]